MELVLREDVDLVVLDLFLLQTGLRLEIALEELDQIFLHMRAIPNLTQLGRFQNELHKPKTQEQF